MEFIRTNLTFENPEYAKATRPARRRFGIDKHLYAFVETEKEVFTTRGFLSLLTTYLEKQKIKYKIKDKTTVAKAHLGLELPDSIKLHPYQKRAARTALKQQRGIIKMPCGTGKTINLLNIAALLDQKTLIVVNTEFIRDQWVNYYKELFDYDVGIVQGQTYDIKDITVAMIPTLAQNKTPPGFYDMWGCAIVDECHHAPAKTLAEVIKKLSCRYMFGTTATAKRSDGLDDLILALLGNIIYSVSLQSLAKQGYAKIPELRKVNTGFISESRRYNKLIPSLIADHNRNELVVQNLLSRRDNYNIVISNRIEQLENIIELYSQHTDDYELVIGRVKKEERANIVNRMRAGELHTIFATQLADEGLDIPILDTIHMIFPTKALGVVEQRVGRIQRPKKIVPLVIEYVDIMIPKFVEFYHRREQLYRSLGIRDEQKDSKKKDKKGKAATKNKGKASRRRKSKKS